MKLLKENCGVTFGTLEFGSGPIKLVWHLKRFIVEVVWKENCENKIVLLDRGQRKAIRLIWCLTLKGSTGWRGL